MRGWRAARALAAPMVALIAIGSWAVPSHALNRGAGSGLSTAQPAVTVPSETNKTAVPVVTPAATAGTQALSSPNGSASSQPAPTQKSGSRTADLLRQAGQKIASQAQTSALSSTSHADSMRALARGEVGTRQRGTASWYANSLHGELTANGERYDRHELTAAHPSLPLGSWVKVTRVGSQRSVLVRVNDRGPFAKRRILDLSFAAARKLGMISSGTAQVVVEVVPEPTAADQNLATSQ